MKFLKEMNKMFTPGQSFWISFVFMNTLSLIFVLLFLPDLSDVRYMGLGVLICVAISVLEATISVWLLRTKDFYSWVVLISFLNMLLISLGSYLIKVIWLAILMVL